MINSNQIQIKSNHHMIQSWFKSNSDLDLLITGCCCCCCRVQSQLRCHLVVRTPSSSTVRRRRFDVRRSSTPLPTWSVDVDALTPPTRRRCRCLSLSATPLKAFSSVRSLLMRLLLFSTYVNINTLTYLLTYVYYCLFSSQISFAFLWHPWCIIQYW